MVPNGVLRCPGNWLQNGNDLQDIYGTVQGSQSTSDVWPDYDTGRTY